MKKGSGYKPPSGAQKRRAKTDAAEQESLDSGDVAISEDWAAAVAKLGPPPRDAARRVEWANHACALLLWDTLNDRRPNNLAMARRRLGGDLVAKIGLTAVKALYESRLRKLEQKVYGKRVRTEANGADGLEEYEPPA